LISAKILSGGAFTVVARRTLKVFGLVRGEDEHDCNDDCEHDGDAWQ